MTNISLYRGGTPEVKYIWGAADHPEYRPPFSQRHLGAQSDLFADERPLEETSPYDSHADGAYNMGNFVIGLPVAPRARGQAAQRKALQAQPLEVGDILQCIYGIRYKQADNVVIRAGFGHAMRPCTIIVITDNHSRPTGVHDNGAISSFHLNRHIGYLLIRRLIVQGRLHLKLFTG